MKDKWDLQCNAGYQSDFHLYCVKHGILMNATCSYGDDKSCRKPSFPLQCPAVQGKEILERWYVYEDLVFYSSHRDSWRDYFSIRGSDQFPTLSQEEEEPQENVVTIQLGNNVRTVKLNGASLGEILRMMNVFTQTDEGTTEEERERRVETRIELLKKLGISKDTLFHSSSEPVEEIEDQGYRISKNKFPSGEEMVLRKIEHVKYEVEFEK